MMRGCARASRCTASTAASRSRSAIRGYNLVAPDVIDIYQEPLEEDFEDEGELVAEIRTTVLHELAHFFGIDDDRLEELGLG